MVGEWVSRGFHEEAELGWPLDVHHSEFIAIDPWRRKDTTTDCVIKALFHRNILEHDAKRTECLRAMPAYNASAPLMERTRVWRERLQSKLECVWVNGRSTPRAKGRLRLCAL